MVTRLSFLVAVLVLLVSQVSSSSAAVSAVHVDQMQLNQRLTGVDVIYPSYLPIVFRNFCSDFFDDFSNLGSGWFTGEDGDFRAEYLNGEYRFLVKQMGWTWLLRAPTCDRPQYIVEVDARWAGDPGAGHGLVIGIVGNLDQFYTFEVNTDYQEYAVWYFQDPGGWVLISYGNSAAIQPGGGTNHLKVTFEGLNFTGEVNGSPLITWAGTPGELGVGLTVTSYSDLPNADAGFDNFKVTQPGSTVNAPLDDPGVNIESSHPPYDAVLQAQKPKSWFRQAQR